MSASASTRRREIGWARRHVTAAILAAFMLGIVLPRGAAGQVLPVTDVVRIFIERAIDVVEDNILAYQRIFQQWWAALAKYLPSGRIRGYAAGGGSPSPRAPIDDQFGYAAGLERALRGGDPAGETYAASVSPLRRIPEDVLRGLSPEARQHFERRYTGVVFADGYEIVGWHAISMQREAQNDINGRLAAIEGDLRAPQPGNIANLQLILASQLLGANVPMMTNAHLGLVINSQLVEAFQERASYGEWLSRDVAAKAALVSGAPVYDGGRATWRLAYGQRRGGP